MLNFTLLFVPLAGLFLALLGNEFTKYNSETLDINSSPLVRYYIYIKQVLIKFLDMLFSGNHNNKNKILALQMSVYGLFIFLFIFIIYDYSSNQFQFIREYLDKNVYDLYMGIDGLSLYFLLLTVIIIPISLLSNWTSISENTDSFITIILLLDMLLLLVFLGLDVLLFYIFFESILPPLFILIGLFGSDNRVRASFYLFLYTLLGSLFLLLSILMMSSTMGVTQYDILYNVNFNYYFQILLFFGVFIAFAIKTPTIFLNIWLLKAHVESPLSGSIILAAIVLKLSLYGIFRLILPILPKAYISCTYFIYTIAVITIIYASVSTLRTIDVKELIAYSSVSHAAVYLMAAFSNTIKGIEGAILLGLAHGFVSSGLFICAGGILYDRSSTRLITYYRGIAQIMPIFCIMFFILCLGNCGTPLTLNFVGEFLSLYGILERSPLLGILASSSIVFSAAYTIYLFNRIAFAGSYSKYFYGNMPDVNKREFYMLLILIILTVVLGIYPNIILDGIHYSTTTLLYNSPIILLIPLFKLDIKGIKIKSSFINTLLIIFLCLILVKIMISVIYYITNYQVNHVQHGMYNIDSIHKTIYEYNDNDINDINLIVEGPITGIFEYIEYCCICGEIIDNTVYNVECFDPCPHHICFKHHISCHKVL